MSIRENIIIGDAHGTIDEFNQLLDKLNYDSKKHRIILCGDIIDRGPDPIGLLRQIRKMNIESVFSNHEEKALRWRTHEALHDLTGKPNPMKVKSEKRKSEWNELSKSDLQWMNDLPYKIHIKDNWYVIHAGLEPVVDFHKQDMEHIIRLRYVDEEGRFVKLKRGKKDQPKKTYFWADKWEQPYNILFGHQRHETPTKYTHQNNVCIALDTGCCFGGHLTAYILEQDKFVQVKAKRNYCDD